MLNKIRRWFYWLWMRGRATKIKLWSAKSIGIDEGYFECHHEKHEIIMQYYKMLKEDNYNEAGEYLDTEFAKLTKKYFGPKFVKA